MRWTEILRCESPASGRLGSPVFGSPCEFEIISPFVSIKVQVSEEYDGWLSPNELDARELPQQEKEECDEGCAEDENLPPFLSVLLGFVPRPPCFARPSANLFTLSENNFLGIHSEVYDNNNRSLAGGTGTQPHYK